MPSKANILKYLGGLERHGIRPGLKRIKKLLASLGNPEQSYPCVHVAGTNGKGSTSAFISSILMESGLRTGVYTSPHLVRFNERIRVNGRLISDADMRRLALLVKKAADKGGLEGDEPTFFEFTTAMAFEYFMEKKVDIAVIETGLGGRLDATNVIRPLAGVITNIGMDHEEFLGPDIKAIAGEKAGIMKKGIPFFTAEDKSKALSVLKKNAARTGAGLYVMGRDFKAQPSAPTLPRGRALNRFDYSGRRLELKACSTRLDGPHQINNAACALAVIETLIDLGFKINGQAIRKGLRSASWPGRMETISKNPLVMLDCAHNPDGARALAKAVRQQRHERLILVIGVMHDKDVDGILKELIPPASVVIATEPKTKRAEKAGSLAEKIASFGKKTLVIKNVGPAVERAISMAGRKDIVLVAGSIFTVGEAKRSVSHIVKKACPL